MIVVGSLICAFIYGLAVLVTMLSPPSQRLAQGSLMDRIKLAHNNLQAHVNLANIKISWQDEFYTTILKVGFTVLTAASEAVYFNEGTNITVSQRTWLEDKRQAELYSARMRTRRLHVEVPPELQGESTLVDGVGLIDEDQFLTSREGKIVTSGFSRERKARKNTNRAGTAATREEGVGGATRSGRWYMSWKLLANTISLLTCIAARITVKIFRLVGLGRWIPNGILKNARFVERAPNPEGPKRNLEFWMLSDSGNLSLPANDEVDVEVETRRRLRLGDPQNSTEEALSTNLYGWFKSGGWWGEADASGDYEPSVADDDTTSVISASDMSTTSDWESDEDEGQRTPTQRRPGNGWSRESTAEPEDAFSRLAELLDQRTLESKQEARLLASHLRSPGPLTRAQYNKTHEKEQVQILSPRAAQLSPEDEEDLLEQIILSRRRTAPSHAQTSTNGGISWTQGADGLGAEGPQCVVCHSSPRTILVWPCRCLSLCDECRVSLAMNNFGSCVCCRRDVVAFSRLYVP